MSGKDDKYSLTRERKLPNMVCFLIKNISSKKSFRKKHCTINASDKIRTEVGEKSVVKVNRS